MRNYDPFFKFFAIFINITILVWLGLFLIRSSSLFLGLDEIIDKLLLITLGIFVLNVIVSYLRIRNPLKFIKKKWSDVLLILPLFKIFKLTELLKASNILGINKIIGQIGNIREAEILSKLWKGFKALTKIKKIRRRK